MANPDPDPIRKLLKLMGLGVRPARRDATHTAGMPAQGRTGAEFKPEPTRLFPELKNRYSSRDESVKYRVPEGLHEDERAYLDSLATRYGGNHGKIVLKDTPGAYGTMSTWDGGITLDPERLDRDDPNKPYMHTTSYTGQSVPREEMNRLTLAHEKAHSFTMNGGLLGSGGLQPWAQRVFDEHKQGLGGRWASNTERGADAFSLAQLKDIFGHEMTARDSSLAAAYDSVLATKHDQYASRYPDSYYPAEQGKRIGRAQSAIHRFMKLATGM